MELYALKIETLLAQKGLTKRELAERCGISQPQISTIVRRGTCAPRTAGKLAAGLGVDVSQIIKEVR